MVKNKISVSDIFVKKLHEKVGKLLSREMIYDIWLSAGGSKSRFAYGLGQARYRGILSALGGSIFLIRDEHVGSETHIESYYWQIVALLIRQYSPSGAIVAHEKAMECSLSNYEIPKTLVLYTRNTDKRVQIGDFSFHFCTKKSGEKSRMMNMYRIFYEQSILVTIDGVMLRCLGYEASLLDVASLRIHDVGIAESLILRFLARYEKKLSREVLGELVSYRYIRSINRIRSLASAHGYDRLYRICLDIIKKEGGGCYLHL